MKESLQLPRQARAARLNAESYNAEANTVDLIWTTGADVTRSDPAGNPYIERLATGSDNVRLERLNAGASFLDTHNSYELNAVIGSVVPGSARMDGGLGLATVKLSSSARAADTVQDIKDGVIRNISIGYSVYAFERTEGRDGSPATMTATDWEPCEISAVPVPADAGAQIRMRSEAAAELNTCIVTRSNISEDKEAILAEENPVIAEAVVEAKTIETVEAVAETPTVEIERISAEAVSAERARISTIISLSRDYGLDDAGQEHAERGTSVQGFKDVILERLKGRSANFAPTVTAVTEPSLEKKEKDWSHIRKHLGSKK